MAAAKQDAEAVTPEGDTAAEAVDAARNEPAEHEDQAPEEGRAPEEAGEDRGRSRAKAAERLARAVEDERLAGLLRALRDQIEALRLPFSTPGAESARGLNTDTISQLDEYVLPRLREETAPVVVVVTGPTGAGKSTLVNSLAGEEISATGVRRPTTGTPVLVCHPDDRKWFARGRLLPGLHRLSAPEDEPGDGLIVAVSEQLPPGLAVIDSPDIDSVVTEHHELARKLASAADQWLFVTSAARYADAPGWRLLKDAGERRAKVAVALSRVPEDDADEVSEHLGEMLAEMGLGDVDRFLVQETRIEGGRLPYDDARPLRVWLAELAADDERKDRLIRESLEGVLGGLEQRVRRLADEVDAQAALRAELRDFIEGPYTAALDEVDEACRDGSLLRGEVLARWQDFAGSGNLVRALNLRRWPFLRRRVQGVTPEGVEALRTALRIAFESVIMAAAERAAEEVAGRWRGSYDLPDELARSSPGLGRRVRETVSSWQEHLVDLIRTEGVTKRSVAKVVSLDEDALALILTIGLLGYGTAGVRTEGAGEVPQRLLRGVFGAESLRNVGAKARSDLRARVSLVFDEESARYDEALDAAGAPGEVVGAGLRQTADRLGASE